MKRLFIFLSALFALFLLQVAPAQAISLGSKTASAKGPDTLLIIQLDPNYVGKPGEIETWIPEIRNESFDRVSPIIYFQEQPTAV